MCPEAASTQGLHNTTRSTGDSSGGVPDSWCCWVELMRLCILYGLNPGPHQGEAGARQQVDEAAPVLGLGHTRVIGQEVATCTNLPYGYKLHSGWVMKDQSRNPFLDGMSTLISGRNSETELFQIYRAA